MCPAAVQHRHKKHLFVLPFYVCVCVCLQLCILNCTQALTRQLNERNVPNEWNGFINSPIDIFSPHNISFEFNCSRETKNPGKNVQFYTVLGNELRVGVSRAIQYFLLSYTVSHIVNQLVMLSEAVVLTIPWYIPFSILHHFFSSFYDNIIWCYTQVKSRQSTIICAFKMTWTRSKEFFFRRIIDANSCLKYSLLMYFFRGYLWLPIKECFFLQSRQKKLII